MQYIQFINRIGEIKLLKELEHPFFVVLMGRRRIGKTRLLKEVFPNDLFLFVWPDRSMDWILENWSLENDLPLFKRFDDLLNYVLDKNIVIFDEFQNFFKIDKAILGSFQKIIDERKFSGKPIKLIVAGSSYSLMSSIFQQADTALYNRRSHLVELGHLPFNDLRLSLNIPFKQIIELWSVFEGIPYYYELINIHEDSWSEIKKLFFSQFSILANEGDYILSMEFGKDSKIYKTILSAIANGKNTIQELSNYFGGKKTSVVKYLDLLRKDFNLVMRITPALSDPKKSKLGRYIIKDNFLSFWFKFIDSKKSLIEQNRKNELISYFENNFTAFIGSKFENLIRNFIRKGLFGKFEIVSLQWGKIPEKSPSKDQYEIDILAWNKYEKKVLLIECKWSELNKQEYSKLLTKFKTISPIIQEKTRCKSIHWYIVARDFLFRTSKIKQIRLINLRELEIQIDDFNM